MTYLARCENCGYEWEGRTDFRGPGKAFCARPCPECGSNAKEIRSVGLSDVGPRCEPTWYAIALAIPVPDWPRPSGPWRDRVPAAKVHAEWCAKDPTGLRDHTSAIYAYDTRDHARKAELFHKIGGPEGRVR